MTLAQPAWFDEARSSTVGTGVRPIGKRARACDAPLSNDIVLVLRGLFVREALAGEHGTWMSCARRPPSPTSCASRFAPARAHSATEALKAHIAARRELERVLDAGGALPPNPDALLPVTRTLDLSRRRCAAASRLTSRSRTSRPAGSIAARCATSRRAVRRAWHLAWSRRHDEARVPRVRHEAPRRAVLGGAAAPVPRCCSIRRRPPRWPRTSRPRSRASPRRPRSSPRTATTPRATCGPRSSSSAASRSTSTRAAPIRAAT